MDKSIMPECYADTLLIEALVPSKTGYNHKMGCFKVEAEMKYGVLKDKFAVGIIDNDKRQIKYLNEFEEIDKIDGSLILWKHKFKSHYIIQICPALEKWIMNVCALENINLVEFGLSTDLEELKKYTKSQSGLDDKKLKGLFKAISNRYNSKDVCKLRSWINILKDKTYKVELNELRNG
jgi:hypothetical protein